jgi:orotate phosphoribosyltransferase
MTLSNSPTMDRKALSKAVFEACYRRGNFKLRSGQTSTEYFDKYRFESQPQILRSVAEFLRPLIPTGTDALAGLEMGGIPIATALSLATGIPTVFVRKKAKEYGTEQFAEGYDIKGKKLLIIEDIVTTGGQVLLSTADLRNAGAIISDVLCVIQRSQDITSFKENHLKLQTLFTMEELKKSTDSK